jgi:1-deoxy-D-xylulose-5-phosphate synthase
MKPLDRTLIDQLASENDVLITIEEGSIGGFGDHVLHYLALTGALDNGTLRVRPMVLPDSYIEAASQNEQYERAGLDVDSIEETLKKLLGDASADPVAEMQKSVERARASTMQQKGEKDDETTG